jgi:hypothetical protein
MITVEEAMTLPLEELEGRMDKIEKSIKVLQDILDSLKKIYIVRHEKRIVAESKKVSGGK